MKIIYNNTELQNNTRSYNTLINRPSLNGQLLAGNISLNTLSLYDKPTVKKLVDAVSQIRLVSTMPADPEPSMTYYVGPDERGLYDVILVNDAKQQINMGTTQFGQYKSGAGINVAANNTININTDDVSVYIDSEGDIAASLDGNALPPFDGATASTNGTKGIVPQPLAGEDGFALFGDGTWKDISDHIYPVGAVIIFNDSSQNPNMIFAGTWEKIDAGYVVWHTQYGGGGFIDAAMPNIKGSSQSNVVSHQGGITTPGYYWQFGAVRYTSGGSAAHYYGGSTNYYGNLDVNFANQNSIYKDGATVQPPAYKVCVWHRTA